MLNFIVFIIGVATIVFFTVCAYHKLDNISHWCEEEEVKTVKKKYMKTGAIGAIVGITIVVFSLSFAIIPTGYTGVRIVFGQVNENTVQNGFNWKIPIVEKIEKVNNKQQDISFENEISSETSARTVVLYNNVTVTYQIGADKSAWIYANISNYKDTLVTEGLISSAIKASSKQLEDEDATNRGKIEPLAMENIQASLDEKYGEGTVIVNKVVIESADFTETYNNAIAEKQNAQLAYEKQQIENQKNIETAEAEAEAQKIAAEGEKEANEILAQSLSDDIFTQMLLEKWDGELPKVVSDSDSVFDVTSLLEDSSQSETE